MGEKALLKQRLHFAAPTLRGSPTIDRKEPLFRDQDSPAVSANRRRLREYAG